MCWGGGGGGGGEGGRERMRLAAMAPWLFNLKVSANGVE